MSIELFLQTFFNGLQGGLLLILVALGITLVFGIMHIVNFAHGELYMVGAFVVWVLFAQHGVNYYLSIIVSMIIVAILGILIERFFFRKYRGNLAPSFIISLGFVMLLQTSTLLLFGITDKAVPPPPGFEGVVSLAGVVFPRERIIVSAISVILIILLTLFMQRSKAGLAMRASAQDRDAAALQGMNINTTASFAMGIGCALAAAAGALTAPIFYVNSYMGAAPIMKAFAVIILGGMGSLQGAIIAGFIIGFVESFTSTFLGGSVSTMMVFGVLILVLVFRPRGLLGHAD